MGGVYCIEDRAWHKLASYNLFTMSSAIPSSSVPSPSNQTFELQTAHGVLHGVVQRPEGASGPLPTVVVCHGFKGFLEWGFFPPLAELLVQRGLAVVRFNFRGSGMRPGDELVTDLDAFRHATFSGDLDDILAVLEAIRQGRLGDGDLDAENMALLGHSRGGGGALLAASQSPWDQQLKALVTWAAVATFDRVDGAAKALWRQQGELVIENGRTGQKLPIGVDVLDDLEARAADLDLDAAAAHRGAPWLIVHGDADPTVAMADAQRLEAQTAGEHRLEIVQGGDHTFGAKHPFFGPTPHLIQVFNATQTWLRRYLTRRP